MHRVKCSKLAVVDAWFYDFSSCIEIVKHTNIKYSNEIENHCILAIRNEKIAFNFKPHVVSFLLHVLQINDNQSYLATG